jgi:hypothetical protein
MDDAFLGVMDAGTDFGRSERHSDDKSIRAP